MSTANAIKKTITNVGVPKEVYEELKKMSCEEICDFLDEKLLDYILKRQKKGCKHFVRIPNVLLDGELNNDIDRLIFLISIHFFNYGNRYNKLTFGIQDIERLFNFRIPVKELKALIEGDHVLINIEYKRPYFVVTPSKNPPFQTEDDNKQSHVETQEFKQEELKNVSLEFTSSCNDMVIDDNTALSKDYYANVSLRDMWGDVDKLMRYQFELGVSLGGDYFINDTYKKVQKRIIELKHKNKTGKEFEFAF